MSTTATPTIGELEAIVGGIGNPSKMPGYAYGIPAAECKVGGRLRELEGSTCSGCYAYGRGNYRFASTVAAQYRRLEAISDPRWIPAMVGLISRKCTREPFFRWHDSGDLQSLEHLEAIAAVAEGTPQVSHWLPTREKRIVSEYLREHGAFPANLTVRISAAMVDGRAPSNLGLPTSTVHKESAPIGHACPAPTQGNACGDCRACWSSDVANVSYHLH